MAPGAECRWDNFVGRQIDTFSSLEVGLSGEVGEGEDPRIRARGGRGGKGFWCILLWNRKRNLGRDQDRNRGMSRGKERGIFFSVFVVTKSV